MKSKLSTTATGLFITIAGGVFGYLGSWWGKRQAEAAINVRPKLAEVGWVDAFFAGHINDWLFYHNPGQATAISIVLFAVIFGLAWVSTQ